MTKKYLPVLLLLSILILFTGCTTTKYSIVPRQKIISDFIGETAVFQVDYSVTNGKITSPQLISNCKSIKILSQQYDNEDKGTITATLLINSHHQENNCLGFDSNEHEEGLFISIIPQKQASIKNIDYPKQINYNQPAEFTVNLLITQRDVRQNLQLTLSSQTPNLKFMLKESDSPIDINSGVIKFTTGEYQDSATPTGYLYLPDQGFPSVDLASITFDLYMEKNGELHLVDSDSINDKAITASLEIS